MLFLCFENTYAFGIAAGRGQPFVPDPREQVSTEMLRRWQVTEVVALAPNVQIIFGRIDPYRGAAPGSKFSKES
jgi:hypothetical protein